MLVLQLTVIKVVMMARIPLVEPKDATAPVKAVYDQLQSGGGPLLNVMKLFGNHEGFLIGFAELLGALYSKHVIAPRYRELAWLRVSQLNDCHY